MTMQRTLLATAFVVATLGINAQTFAREAGEAPRREDRQADRREDRRADRREGRREDRQADRSAVSAGADDRPNHDANDDRGSGNDDGPDHDRNDDHGSD
jgi:hypothetical protein